MASLAHPYRRFGGRWLVVAACVVASVVSMQPGQAPAASSAVAVSFTLLSQSTLDLGGCAPGSAATQFGAVPAGTNAVSPAPCSVVFGSTNNSAMLLVGQHDGASTAMSMLPTAVFDTNSGDGDSYDVDGRASDSVGSSDAARAVGHQRFGVNAGKVVVAGASGTAPNRQVYVQRRTTTTGLLDGTFGTAGAYQFALTANEDYARDIVVLDDDSIVVAGIANTNDAFVLKLTPDGALDTTFSAGDGTDGYWVYDTGSTEQFEALLPLPDGRIAVSGNVGNNAVVAMMDASGRFDSTWGTSGISVFDVGGNVDNAESMALDASGRIVIAGRTTSGDMASFFSRLTATGGVDPTFGVGGFRVIDVVPPTDDLLLGVAVQPSGRIVGVGRQVSGSVTSGLLAAVTPTGAIDTSFLAPTGYGPVTIGSSDTDFTRIAMHGDGRFVVSGSGYDATVDRDMAIGRFLPSGAPDPSFASGGTWLIDVSGSTNAEDIDIGYDGKYTLAGEAAAGDIGSMRLDAQRVPDQGAGNDFANGTGSFFAACLESVGGAATAVWTTTGACVTSDVTPWRAVPQQSVAGAKVATTSAGGTGTANLRFGMRASLTATTGSYEAPLVFDVVAPAA